jgi:hypothetical protein
MIYGLSWRTESYSDCQEIARFIIVLTEAPPFYPVMSQLNQIHTFRLTIFNINCI